MIKYAVCEDAIVEKICDKAGRGSAIQLKYASAAFGKSHDFSGRYQKMLNNYIVAQADGSKNARIGSYDPEFHYYRVIAMHGDVPNDNGDMFRWGNVDKPEEPELLRWDETLGKNVYQTFVGRGNFKNHQNDDVSKAVGVILDVVPNFDGRFIEALVAVDNKKDPDLVRSIDKGYVKAVSMGARVAYSLCSICGHIAKTESEYCAHVKNSKGGKIYHEGAFRDVYEDNRQVNFIELSWVTVPADRYALMLEKVARRGRANEAEVLEAVGLISEKFGEDRAAAVIREIAASVRS